MQHRNRQFFALCTIAGASILFGGARDCLGYEVTEPVACTEEYAPVCGVDGETYSNQCFLEAAGIAKASDGECIPAEVICHSDSDCSEGHFCDFPVYASASSADVEVGCLPVREGVCHPIDLPTLCSSDEECGEHEVCQFTGCACVTEPCDCPPVHGECVPEPTEPPPPARCGADSDCLEGEHCEFLLALCDCVAEPATECLCGDADRGGFCAPNEPPGPAWCVSDADCEAYEFCFVDFTVLPASEGDSEPVSIGECRARAD